MAPNSPHSRVENIKYRRRQFLRAAGIAGAVTIAGCSGDSEESTPTSENSDGEDNGDSTPSTGTSEPIDSAFSCTVSSNPNDVQYNTYNATATTSGEVEAVVFEPLVKNDKVNREWIPVTVSDWTLDGDTLDLQLNDEYMWHDGDPVTAEDLATQLRIDLELGQPTADYVDSVEVTGEHALRLTLASDSINRDLLFLNVLDTRLYTKTEIYGPYLEALEKAETKKETEAAQAKLLEWVIDEPVGSGPFKFESADTQRVLTTKFEDYPGADQINFPEYEFKFMSGNQVRWQGLLSNVTDGEPYLGITQEVLNTFPDHIDLIRPPEAGGTSLLFQHKDTVFSDPRVRKAVTYILRGERLTSDSTLNYQFQEMAMNTGLMPTQAQNFVSDEVLSSLTNYNVDQSTAEERATALLQDAGFSREGGTWMKPNGDTFKLPIKTIGAWWSLQAQAINGQLREFGIQSEFVSLSLGAFFGDISDGNYVMAISFYSGSHPYQCLSTVFDVDGGSGQNVPAEFEVPPVGEPDGDTETVNVRNLIDEMRNTRDEAKMQELVEQLVWTYNQKVTRVPHLIGTGMAFMTDDEWNYPALDSDVMQIFEPPFWLLRTGDLKAETQ